jgi:hypothetical protein
MDREPIGTGRLPALGVASAETPFSPVDEKIIEQLKARLNGKK